MENKQTFRISFSEMRETIQVAPGCRLIDAIRLAGMGISAPCGGNHRCGRCRIILVSGTLTPPDETELEYLSPQDIATGIRLACCTAVCSDLQITLPKTTFLHEHSELIGGAVLPGQLDPMVNVHNLFAASASLEEPKSDHLRIDEALQQIQKTGHTTADPVTIAQMPIVLREYDHHVSVFLRGNEIIGIRPLGIHPLGLAVDLGTTKIAAKLVDLIDGREVAVAGRPNPQAIYGDDIISRLTYVIHHPNDHELTRLVRKALQELLVEVCRISKVSQQDVADVCIVCNTAMAHLLLELPVHALAMSPFVAASNAAIDVKARDLGLRTAPGAYVHLLPGIGGFVGSDHVSMILALGFDQLKTTAIGLDIGTNTEIVLHRPDTRHLYAASCASGPAFEAAEVSSGMKAATGAIDTVRLQREGPVISTIGDSAPTGICGSGIVDLVAELFRWGIVNGRGRLCGSAQRVRHGSCGLEYVLVDAEKSGTDRDIVLTQKDIDQVQLAKGAIRAGISTLLAETGTDPELVQEIYLAGAFGSYLNIESATRIGMIPFWKNCIIKQVGNAAAAGARLALLSREARNRAAKLAATTRHIELSRYPGFGILFAKGMLFERIDRA